MPSTRSAPNMKRGILGFLLLELMLAGFWIYLVSLDPGNVEFQSRVGEAMGMAMGGLLGVFAVLFFIAVRRRTQLPATQEPSPSKPPSRRWRIAGYLALAVVAIGGIIGVIVWRAIGDDILAEFRTPTPDNIAKLAARIRVDAGGLPKRMDDGVTVWQSVSSDGLVLVYHYVVTHVEGASQQDLDAFAAETRQMLCSKEARPLLERAEAIRVTFSTDPGRQPIGSVEVRASDCPQAD